MNINQVVKRPIITEKSTDKSLKEGKYTFKVAPSATKTEIKKAVERFFKVNVKGVQTIKVKGKSHRVGRLRRETKSADWKKAIVQLAKGEKIDVFTTGE